MVNQTISLFEKLFAVSGQQTIIALLLVIAVVLICKGGK